MISSLIKQRRFSAASEEKIAAKEQQLGCRLPPSYREFLLTVNGCPKLGMAHGGLWPVAKIEWFCRRNQEWIDIWCSTRDDDEGISRQQHLANRDNSVLFRHAYMQDLLLLREGQDGAVYLLNPKVKTSNGEWEAWNFANWYPGAYRYPSFRSMVLNTHKSLMQESRLPPSNVAQGQDENPSVQVEESPIIDEAFIEVALPLLRDKIKQGVDPADAVAGYIKIKSQKSKS